MIGRKISHYRITAKLGEGGMGVVYQATDTKLSREVALKVLPEEFARDKNRMARFRREAQLLASLNHPNIAAIHGLEEEGGTQALALELVEGPTLAERIAQGALPLDQSLPIARQIAEALDAAHNQGVIHRDLKPANIKVTDEGVVKVLDFGLAKALEGSDAEADIASSPTLSVAATRAGIILGTAAYMSPEQARGGRADRRADIWSFGVVLYEMLTGKHAFTGDTISDILARVIERDPDWEALPNGLPPPMRQLLERCLTKDKRRRLGAISEATFAIEEFLSNPEAASAEMWSADGGTPAGEPRWRRVLPWALTGVFALAAILLALWPSVPEGRPGLRLTVSIPPSETLRTDAYNAIALSPDGSLLAFVSRSKGKSHLYLRPLDRFEATPIAGTEGASSPFFSPDGQWIGFFAGTTMKKVSISGSTPQTICTWAFDNRGASWAQDGTIYFTPVTSPLSGVYRVAASGGIPEPLTIPDPDKGEGSHRWPEVLPGNEAILMTVERRGAADFSEASIVVQSLKTGERQVLIEGGMHGRYSPTGHILYARANNLLAAPFDLERLKITGPSVPVLEGVFTAPTSGVAQFSVSSDGTLAYLAVSAYGGESTLAWVDRRGKMTPLLEGKGLIGDVNISPDGRRLILSIEAGNADLWLYDLGGGSLMRMTFGEGDNLAPIWNPDGKRITFMSSRGGSFDLYSMMVDRSAPPELLLDSKFPVHPVSWSPDGRRLVYQQEHPETQSDLWMLPLAGERKPQPILHGPFDEMGAAISPDGKWLVYASNETGENEIYVQPFPGPGGKRQISTTGGSRPAWSPSGGELFYLDVEHNLVSVPVKTGQSFSAGPPTTLYDSPIFSQSSRPFDITPDGRRFAAILQEEGTAPTHVNMIMDWFEELRRLAPAGN